MRARRSRWTGAQSASSARRAATMSAAWTERTAPSAGPSTVESSASRRTRTQSGDGRQQPADRDEEAGGDGDDAAATARTAATLPGGVTLRATPRVPETKETAAAALNRGPTNRTSESDLAIKDVAERTGIAAGTIRMWEQRYGFPAPGAHGRRATACTRARTSRRCGACSPTASAASPSPPRSSARARPAGHRPALALRRASRPASRRPRRSCCASATLIALSRAIEDETIARAAAPVVFGAFQRERHYRAVEHRYRRDGAHRRRRRRVRRLRGAARRPATARPRCRSSPATRSATSGRSSSTRPATPRACSPGSSPAPTAPGGAGRPRAALRGDLDARRPRGAPRGAHGGARWRGARTPALGERIDGLLADRPLALEQPAPR